MNSRSRRKLRGVHAALVSLANHADKGFQSHMEKLNGGGRWHFVVTEGLRTRERQGKLIKAGASGTMESRHLTGHAIDIAIFCNDDVSWLEKHYDQAYLLFHRISKEINVPITWGGHWTRPHDGPHYQLTWADYPIKEWASKKPEDSKTIGSATAIAATVATTKPLLDVVEKVSGSGNEWLQYVVVLAVVALFAGLIIKERMEKVDRDGN